MDWDGYVALATLLLAIGTFMSVYQSRKQSQAIIRQLKLQIGQQIPHIFVRNVTFESNSLTLDIENATDTPAFRLGLSTSYFPVLEKYYADKDGKQEINWGETVKLREDGKTVYMKYYSTGLNNRPKLNYDGQEVQSDSAVSFFAPQGVSQYLPPKTNIQVKTTPRFAVSWQDKESSSFQGFAFDEFRNFLLKNNIHAVAVVMYLICRDSAEMTHTQGEIARFAIVTSTDKTLADSGKNPQHFEFLAVPFLDSLGENSYISGDTYRDVHSGWNVRD